MCVGALGGIIGALGSIFGAIGQMKMMQAQAAEARYQAAVARNNEIIAKRFSKDALARGAEAEAKKRLQTRSLLAKEKVVFGTRNIDMSSGSPLDILGDTAQLGEIDALTVKKNFQRDAIGFQAQGMNYHAQSDVYNMQADNLQSSAPFMMFSTILGSVGKFA